jgi:hypothetical protein
MLRAGYGGLVCCAKRDEAKLWRSYLRETGREGDGRFFGVNEPFRLNFIDHESKTSNLDYVENLVNLLVDVASIKRSDSGGNQPFWRAEKMKLVRNTLSLLLLAELPVEIKSIYQAIASSPRSADQLKSADWRASSFLCNLIVDARKRNAGHEEFSIIENYFLLERMELHSGTRGTIEAEFTGTFDPLRRGKIGELFGTYTNLSPDDILSGRVVIVDVSTDDWREIGQLANVIWVQCLQRAIDRRTFIPGESRPIFMWQDEAYKFAIDTDSDFQAGARSKGLAAVRLCQGLPAYLDAFGKDGKHKVDALLGAHATKLFHRNDCPITNKWSSELIARETVYRPTVSRSATGGSSAINTSLAMVEESACAEKQFLGLKTSGPKNKWVSEAILFQSGRLFDGERWTGVRFNQKP